MSKIYLALLESSISRTEFGTEPNSSEDGIQFKTYKDKALTTLYAANLDENAQLGNRRCNNTIKIKLFKAFSTVPDYTGDCVTGDDEGANEFNWFVNFPQKDQLPQAGLYNIIAEHQCHDTITNNLLFTRISEPEEFLIKYSPYGGGPD